MSELNLKDYNLVLIRKLMKTASMEDIQVFNDCVQKVIQERQDEEELKRLEQEERNEKIAEVMKLIEQSGLSVDDLTPQPTKPEKRYRYTVNGKAKTWSGKGPKPQALQALLNEGRNLEEFAVS